MKRRYANVVTGEYFQKKVDSKTFENFYPEIIKYLKKNIKMKNR